MNKIYLYTKTAKTPMSFRRAIGTTKNLDGTPFTKDDWWQISDTGGNYVFIPIERLQALGREVLTMSVNGPDSHRIK